MSADGAGTSADGAGADASQSEVPRSFAAVVAAGAGEAEKPVLKLVLPKCVLRAVAEASAEFAAEIETYGIRSIEKAYFAEEFAVAYKIDHHIKNEIALRNCSTNIQLSVIKNSLLTVVVVRGSSTWVVCRKCGPMECDGETIVFAKAKLCEMPDQFQKFAAAEEATSWRFYVNDKGIVSFSSGDKSARPGPGKQEVEVNFDRIHGEYFDAVARIPYDVPNHVACQAYIDAGLPFYMSRNGHIVCLSNDPAVISKFVLVAERISAFVSYRDCGMVRRPKAKERSSEPTRAVLTIERQDGGVIREDEAKAVIDHLGAVVVVNKSDAATTKMTFIVNIKAKPLPMGETEHFLWLLDCRFIKPKQRSADPGWN